MWHHAVNETTDLIWILSIFTCVCLSENFVTGTDS